MTRSKITYRFVQRLWLQPNPKIIQKFYDFLKIWNNCIWKCCYIFLYHSSPNLIENDHSLVFLATKKLRLCAEVKCIGYVLPNININLVTVIWVWQKSARPAKLVFERAYSITQRAFSVIDLGDIWSSRKISLIQIPQNIWTSS